MNCFDFARRHFGEFKTHGSELIPKLCPYCHGGSKANKETFALNFENKTFNCKRGSCGKQGHFTQLCKDFGEQADRDEQYYEVPRMKSFKKPESKVETATEKVENYLKIRGFSKATWERYGVGEHNGAIAFPYKEKGETVLMKFRKPEKYTGNGMKAWREEGGKSVLWGMDLCDITKPLVITEGEYDTLALAECGIENVVSVPSGASDLTWIDNCWDWLHQFEKIIFWGDNDEPGKKMVQDCILRLGQDRCYLVTSQYKDANESLFKAGREITAVEVELAKPVPVYGLLDLADIIPVDVIHSPKVKSGISSIDADIQGFLMGELSVWSGKSGQGKSTLLGQVLLNAVEVGESVCAYSGELRADRFQYWVNLQAAGRENIIPYKDASGGKEYGVLRQEIVKQIREWYRGKFWLYDNSIADNGEETSVLKVFQYAAKRYGCKVFLVDNLMTSRFTARNDNDFYRAQSNFVGELVHFAKAYGVHVHLVAHPRKTSGKLGKDDISGTADINNRADNVFTVDRAGENEPLSASVTILKNRSFGIQDQEYGLHFDTLSKRFWGQTDTIGEGFAFGWVPKPAQATSVFDKMEEGK